MRTDLTKTDHYNNLAIFDSKELLPIEEPHYTSFSSLNASPKVIKFTHKWTIDDYNKVCQNNVRSLESLFSPENGAQEKLQLAVILYPFGLEKDSKNAISLLLHLKSFGKLYAIIQYKFSILNQKGKKVCAEGIL